MSPGADEALALPSKYEGAFRALQASAPHQGECGVYFWAIRGWPVTGNRLSGGLPCILAVRAAHVTPECADRPSRAPKNPPPFREEQGMRAGLCRLRSLEKPKRPCR